MFVLNLFLPIVMFVFQLWWMLKLKFCIPPSIEFEAELAAELDGDPGGLEVMAEHRHRRATPASTRRSSRDGLQSGLDRQASPAVSATRLDRRTLTNDPLVQAADRPGLRRTDGEPAPRRSPAIDTAPVRRDEVVHP